MIFFSFHKITCLTDSFYIKPDIPYVSIEANSKVSKRTLNPGLLIVVGQKWMRQPNKGVITIINQLLVPVYSYTI